jgi:hypothetical protein
MRVLFFFLLLLSLQISAAGENNNPKVIYKYKNYEKFDLGNLEIKGSIIAPGDLSVKDRIRRTFSRDLCDRADFNREVIKEIKNLR